MSLGFGLALRSKKVSASGWSAVEAAPKQKPVITPEGSTAVKREKPSYQPRLLDQPMSAYPASQPFQRRFASRPRASPRRRGPGIGELVTLHDLSQMQGYLLDGVCMEAHKPVELRAV